MRPDPKSMSAQSARAVADVFDRVERAWYPNEVTNIDESWDYQAWPVDEFMIGLEVCAKIPLPDRPGLKFLDVGSGIGTKLALASAYGFDVTGVEFRPQYAAMTRFICPEAKVYGSDARMFDYAPYDLIYAYLPLRRMGVLLDRITEQAKPGVVLFMPECDGLSERGWRKTLAWPSVPVWVR
jgi:SAM-dependent methyltransferase